MTDSGLSWLLWSVYLVCSFLYLAYFIRRKVKWGLFATGALGVGLIYHLILIVLKTVHDGNLPFATLPEAVSIFVWFTLIAYLILELTTQEKAIGALIVPFVTMLQLIPTIYGYKTGDFPDILRSVWFGIHVSSSLFAYSSLALSFVVGILYVLLFHEIKAKHLGFFYSRLPSLAILDKMGFVAVATGLVFLTFAIINGFVWAAQVTQRSFMSDPKVIFSIINWSIYVFYIHLRQMKGWQGKRLAYLSIIGFILVLFNFLIIGLFFSQSHRF